MLSRYRTRNRDRSCPQITVLDSDGVAAEAYRALRANLLYLPVEPAPRVISLTSPSFGEGKSTVCANLGVSLAQAGQEVLILDCNQRRPSMHEIFGVDNAWGLINVLTGKRKAEEVWWEVAPGLSLLSAGSLPRYPGEISNSGRLLEILDQMRQRFDYVLIDSPPVESNSDSVVLAAQSEGVLLIVDATQTSKKDIRRSLGRLQAVGANVLGTVMNNVKATKHSNIPQAHV